MFISEKVRLGYACINSTLGKSAYTNRGMIKRTFEEKGVPYASKLALENVKDLYKILRWNKQNGFTLFRMSSDIFPWASEYEMYDMPDWEEIEFHLKKCGDFAKENGIRLSFHPGQFNILSSEKDSVVKNSIRDLRYHGEVMDAMGLSRNRGSKINIHLGAAFGNKQESLKRWRDNFGLLPESVKTRLTLENDDKGNLYSAEDLFYGVYEHLNIPITFDMHHHKFCSGGLSEEEALKLSASTWGDIVPCCHYSESAAINENRDVNMTAHSRFIFNKIENYDLRIDVVVEAKEKELAVLDYIKRHVDVAKTL